MVLCIVLFVLITSGETLDLAPFENNSDSYPSTIPVYRVRRDVYTNEEVTTGRINLIGGLEEQQVSIDYFRRALQCRTKRQYIRESYGIWDFIKNIKPSAELIKMLSAWHEIPYGKINDWKLLRMKAKEFEKGNYPKALQSALGSPFQNRLYRSINGTLHRDWPWGMERFTTLERRSSETLLPILTLLKIGKSVGDVVFFSGQEMSIAPYRFPFPIFSSSPTFMNGDLPMPWNHELHVEMELYMHHKKAGTDLSKKYDQASTVPWSKKHTKACFFGSTHWLRQYIMDVAIMRPDLMDAGWTQVTDSLIPWNPESDEGEQSRATYATKRHEAMTNGEPVETRPGFARSYYPFKLEKGVHYIHLYKYIVVIDGLSGRGTADRLASMLAYSGAVVLLQDTVPMYYHFSYHLKPWVHYVPVSYNLGDVIDKIEWLNENEDLALQIVANAQAFAKSHLRLEDYLCYMGNAFEVISDHVKGTSAVEPFQPQEMDKGR